MGGSWQNADLASNFDVVQSTIHGHHDASGAFKNQKRGKHDATGFTDGGIFDENYLGRFCRSKSRDFA
jgi:hypothetical protein